MLPEKEMYQFGNYSKNGLGLSSHSALEEENNLSLFYIYIVPFLFLFN